MRDNFKAALVVFLLLAFNTLFSSEFAVSKDKIAGMKLGGSIKEIIQKHDLITHPYTTNMKIIKGWNPSNVPELKHVAVRLFEGRVTTIMLEYKENVDEAFWKSIKKHVLSKRPPLSSERISIDDKDILYSGWVNDVKAAIRIFSKLNQRAIVFYHLEFIDYQDKKEYEQKNAKEIEKAENAAKDF